VTEEGVILTLSEVKGKNLLQYETLLAKALRVTEEGVILTLSEVKGKNLLLCLFIL
jgi:hypothetical protein